MAMYKYSLYTELIERERLGDDEHEDYFVEVHILGMNTRVIGMLSNIPGIREMALARHIFMMDTIPLTDIELLRLREKLQNLHRYQDLSIVLIRSSLKDSNVNSYHVIIPHPFTIPKIRDLTLSTFRKEADILFFGLGEKRGFWDLRITSKGRGDGDSPTLMQCWMSPDPSTHNNIKPISLVHWRIMALYLNIPPLSFETNKYGINNMGNMDEVLIRYSVKA